VHVAGGGDAVDGTFSADFLCLILPVRLRAKDRSAWGPWFEIVVVVCLGVAGGPK